MGSWLVTWSGPVKERPAWNGSKTSVNAIRSSPEVRKMASDAMVLAGQMVRRVPGGDIGGTVARTLASRGAARSQTSRAA